MVIDFGGTVLSKAHVEMNETAFDFGCTAFRGSYVIFNRVAHSAGPWKWKRGQGIRDKKSNYYETLHVGIYKMKENCNINNNKTRCRNGLVTKSHFWSFEG